MFTLKNRLALRSVFVKTNAEIRNIAYHGFIRGVIPLINRRELNEVAKVISIQETWNWIDSAVNVSVMLESGRLLPLESDLFERFDNDSPLNGWIDIQSGSIAPGDLPEAWSYWSSPEKVMGRFTGLPLFLEFDSPEILDLFFYGEVYSDPDSYKVVIDLAYTLAKEMRIETASSNNNSRDCMFVNFEESESPDIPDVDSMNLLMQTDRRNQVFAKHTGGRPRLTQLAASAYTQKYPSGHGQKTWMLVERELGYSAKTIKRGIKELDLANGNNPAQNHGQNPISV